MTTGQLIDKKLREMGKTQIWLGKQLNYTAQYINNWKGGRSSPPLDKIKLICCLLNISNRDITKALLHDYEKKIKELLK